MCISVNKPHKVVFFILALMLITVLPLSVQAKTSDYDVVVSIPVGTSDASIGYTDIDGRGTPEGPSGFCVYGENIYLIDNVNSIIRVFDKNSGKSKISINIPKDTWAFGIAVDNSKIYLLDVAQKNMVVLEDKNFETVSVYDVDIDFDAIAQFGITNASNLYIVRSGKTNMESILLELSKDNKITPSKSFAGNIAPDNNTWSIHWPEKKTANIQFVIDKNGKSTGYDLPIGLVNINSAIHYIGCTGSNLLLHVVSSDKETICAIDPVEGITGICDIPSKCYALSNNNISFDNETGNVYLLQTMPDEVQIIKTHIRKFEGFANVCHQPDEQTASVENSLTSSQINLSSISRSQIMSNARAYHSQQWYCNKYNYNGTNASTPWAKPRYLNQGYYRYYQHVPYCWGGFTSLSQFSSQLSNNYAAGNIACTGYYKANTTGVDCSGYISRCWGLTSKQGTYGLMDSSISNSISFSSLLQGDILCNSGHVMLFDQTNSNGDYVLYESTLLNSYDRVSHTVRSKSYVENNYGAYRYKYVN